MPVVHRVGRGHFRALIFGRQETAMRRTRGLIGGVLWTAGLVAMCGSVAAHTRLTSSVPADGEVLPAGAHAVTLEFSEAVQPRFSDFALHFVGDAADAAPSADNRVARQEPVIDAARKRVAVPLPETPQAGWYVLDWEVLAEDGHRLEGTLLFRIAP
jgi:methionine-rich copper-binding protein CopC